ncbi:MAG: Gfo/Idh/MocA family oxidoreductase [Phycisphaerae bacterium]|nr:Gfo/Idh/MocA family oxidoreductase [Phycisphaerae bacterium]
MSENTVGRRGFLKGAAGAAGLFALAPGSALGASANERIEIGVIGSGNRGTWIGALFEEHANAKVVAVHDYFEDKVAAAGERFGVEASRRYVGLDGYHELLESKLDAVAIESPPYFHPEQAVAALEAGKHVYLAKPIAVDVPGCMAIVDAAAKADGKFSLLVDFQTRNDPLYIEAARRVHEGLIGTPICGQAYYEARRNPIKDKSDTPVGRLRNWLFDTRLSGDIIVEQNIHVLDVANWLLRAHPVKASGTGALKVRTDVGDCWDHYVVTYWYPNDVLIDFSSRQFGYGFDDLCARIYCDLGTVDTHYGGRVFIKGKSEAWEGGETSTIYRDGAVNNIKDFCASIAEGRALNNAAESAQSTMTAILGRVAAHAGRPVTWDEMVAANERIDPGLNLPEDGPYTKAVRG